MNQNQNSSNIQLFVRGPDKIQREIPLMFWKFPAGEVGVKIDLSIEENNSDKYDSLIIARIQNSDDIMKLLMLRDAMSRVYASFDKHNLVIPYLPYSRQDRINSLDGRGESLSIKVMANLINNMNFYSVTTLDCHSDASACLIDELVEIPQWAIVAGWPELYQIVKNAIIVAPDTGSLKKIDMITKGFNISDVIRADKKRDMKTGEILETIVYSDDLKGRDVIILDDIIEKGHLFIELAKALKKKNAGKINLYITHGIFSGGYEEIFASGIDQIFTTNSYRTDINHPQVKVFKIEHSYILQ